MSDIDLKAVEDRLGEIAAHAKEARELAKDTLTKAETEERFKKMAADVVAAKDEERKARAEENEAILTRLDETNTAIEQLRYAGAGNDAAKAKEEREAYYAAMRGFILEGNDSRALRDYRETRALNETVGPEGGYLTTKDTEEGLIRNVTNLSPMWNLARTTVLSPNADALRLRTSTGATGYWVGESSEPTKSSAGYGTLEIPAHRCAVETVASIDLLDDVSYMETEMAVDAALALDVLVGAALISGDGAGKPLGIMDTNSGLDSVDGEDASSNVIAWQDGYKLLFGDGSTGKGLKAPYRKNSTFAFNSNTLSSIMQLEDSNGDPIWKFAPGDGAINTVWNRPWEIFEDMDDEGDGKYPIICGDFYQGYRIVRKPGLYILRDPYTAKPDVEIMWRMRIGGRVSKVEAFKTLAL